MKHLLTTADLSTEQIERIFAKARQYSQGRFTKVNEQLFATNLFFEPSTRTKTSFEVAERRLGLEVIPFETATSSLTKGESMYDTVRTLESLGLDLIVIRHEEKEFFKQLEGVVSIPIINGGDGSGHHPTQSLLDMYTIYEEFGGFKGIKVAIIGDILHSRVTHSNAELLTKLGAEVVFSGPEVWFDENLLKTGKFEEIDQAIASSDVVMMLRIQHERHAVPTAKTNEEYHEKYGLTVEREKTMKENSIIMHPAPVNRGVEIADELVEGKRSRIFKQMENGVYVRMAIIDELLLETRGGKVNDCENYQWSIA